MVTRARSGCECPEPVKTFDSSPDLRPRPGWMQRVEVLMVTRVVVWTVFVLAVAVFCLVKPQAARGHGAELAVSVRKGQVP
jgi:hypothetical protein